MAQEWRPTRRQVEQAAGRTIRDVLGPGLAVVFCGINPSLYSAAVGHHFARPGNRFWPALHRAGFTPRELSPFEDRRLPEFGCGVTNLMGRATARADELDEEELRRGAERLKTKARRHEPRCIAFVGLGAYRTAFGDRRARVGPQDRAIGPSRVWLLPNTSGINAHYQLRDLVKLFGKLRRAVNKRRA